MNEYIQNLVDQGKLDLVLQKNAWQFDESPYIISGPCSVESEKMIVDWAVKLKKIGVNALRGGAFKPCTYPVKKSIGTLTVTSVFSHLLSTTTALFFTFKSIDDLKMSSLFNFFCCNPHFKCLNGP